TDTRATTRWSWHALALAAFGLWLATLGVVAGVVWKRRRRPGVAPVAADGARRLRNAWLHAVRGAGVAAQAAALLAWARAERPRLRNLGELAAALDAPAQRDAIASLQQAQYAAGGGAPDREALARAFASGYAWRTTPTSSASPLPPLYPS
ncbi:MAG TPA: protein BatD, partial [Rhodanobacteraceae bacterium]|nr:protein BatD [Rhodanobacteraceae bacterium]